jgi:diguanylate cyclase (GGDEF)-like protein
MRHADTLARIGGDEFVIVCADVHGATAATSIARRIIDVLTVPFDVNGAELAVTASIGISIGAGDENVDELLRRADAALYTAKKRGPSGIEIFTPGATDAVSPPPRVVTLAEMLRLEPN